jgi:hypothetical protein
VKNSDRAEGKDGTILEARGLIAALADEEQSAAPNKSSSALRGPKTVLMWNQVFTYQRRLATTALLGFAPARSARASAANHRESTSCQNDDSVIANVNVTSKVTD